MDVLPYPVRFSVDYPDRQLDRVSTFFRLIFAIPIFVLFTLVAGNVDPWLSDNLSAFAGTGGSLFIAPLLMILIRQKYPRWWFDWNLELQRLSYRISTYVALMDDRYPSTDNHQSVHLDYDYPDVERDLNRWLPLFKWFLAIPHYIVLLPLVFLAFGAVAMAWVAILITGHYPRRLFRFVEGVFRWNNRVSGYAFTFVTDRYPPFRLSE